MNRVRKGWDGQFGLEAREALQSSSSGRESSSATVQTIRWKRYASAFETGRSRQPHDGDIRQQVLRIDEDRQQANSQNHRRRLPCWTTTTLRTSKKKTCHSLARQNGEAAKTSRIDSLRFLVYTRWSLQHSNQSTMCKLQGHVGTAIQALGFGLDWAASRPRRCAPRSGFGRSSPHPRAWLLMYVTGDADASLRNSSTFADSKKQE